MGLFSRSLQLYQITVTAGDIIITVRSQLQLGQLQLGHSYISETIQLGQCYKWVTLQLYQDTVTTGDILPLGHSYNWKMLQKGQCYKWVTYRSQLQLGTLQLGHSYNWETLQLGQCYKWVTLQLCHSCNW